MLLFGEVLFHILLLSKCFIAVTAMEAQCILIGILSITITAVMLSLMCNRPYMSNVLCGTCKMYIAFMAIAMFCSLLVALEYCCIKKSFSALLAVWVLL